MQEGELKLSVLSLLPPFVDLSQNKIIFNAFFQS